MGAMSVKFQVGDMVQPKPEWIGTPNNVPSGRVRMIVTWGKDGALYVGDDSRAFSTHVFERIEVPR